MLNWKDVAIVAIIAGAFSVLLLVIDNAAERAQRYSCGPQSPTLVQP